MKQYYFYKDNQIVGPFEIDQLVQNGLRSDSKVWCDGMTSWQTASQVEELDGLFAQSATNCSQPVMPSFSERFAAPQNDVLSQDNTAQPVESCTPSSGNATKDLNVFCCPICHKVHDVSDCELVPVKCRESEYNYDVLKLKSESDETYFNIRYCWSCIAKKEKIGKFFYYLSKFLAFIIVAILFYYEVYDPWLEAFAWIGYILTYYVLFGILFYAGNLLLDLFYNGKINVDKAYEDNAIAPPIQNLGRDYYMLKDNNQVGPLTYRTLIPNGMTPETEVWYDGLETWTPASEVECLRPILYPMSYYETQERELEKQALSSSAKPPRSTRALNGNPILRKVFKVVLFLLLIFYAVISLVQLYEMFTDYECESIAGLIIYYIVMCVVCSLAAVRLVMKGGRFEFILMSFFCCQIISFMIDYMIWDELSVGVFIVFIAFILSVLVSIPKDNLFKWHYYKGLIKSTSWVDIILVVAMIVSIFISYASMLF